VSSPGHAIRVITGTLRTLLKALKKYESKDSPFHKLIYSTVHEGVQEGLTQLTKFTLLLLTIDTALQ
jgi:hypothetical protein